MTPPASGPGSLQSQAWAWQPPASPAYLEDRGQVLSHFQCLSLHRVNHILHPGAGVAAGPASERKGQPGQWSGVRKCPRCRRLASAPAGSTQGDGTRREGRDEGEGRPARRARAGRALLAPQAARSRPGPAVTWPRARAAGLRWKKRAHAHPLPSREESSLPAFTRAPSGFRFLLSPSRRSSAATWASRDTGASGHVTRQRPRWGGIGSLLPSLRKRNTERACAMGARSAFAQSGSYCAFCSGIGGSGPKAYSPFFSSHRFSAYGP